ncbi:MAG: hypothetical protein IJ153_11045 [Clostridia bacterium]|nr:hypothetical protein [Clostridia bacterium]MBQ9212223.1 hypothetical protein [Clostridia bacterium]
MLARKCDRCKVLYEPFKGKYENIPADINTAALYYRDMFGLNDQNPLNFDLCPHCMEGAVKYLTDPDSEVV